MNLLPNYHAYSEKLSAAGQITADQIKNLPADGFEVLINISPVSAKNALANEALHAEETGLIYAFLPVNCADLQPWHFQSFSALLSSFDKKKTLVHCGGNIKTSCLIHMHQVLIQKRDEAESLKELLSIHQPEEKWFAYFKTAGMSGLAR